MQGTNQDEWRVTNDMTNKLIKSSGPVICNHSTAKRHGALITISICWVLHFGKLKTTTNMSITWELRTLQKYYIRRLLCSLSWVKRTKNLSKTTEKPGKNSDTVTLSLYFEPWNGPKNPNSYSNHHSISLSLMQWNFPQVSFWGESELLDAGVKWKART